MIWLRRCLGALLLAGATIGEVPALDLSRLPSQYQHDEYGVADGLPSAFVWDIHLDAAGYLWVGTDAGLVRYDGQTFDLLSHDAAIFRSPDVRAIASTGSGRLLVGTAGGGLVRWQAGRFESVAFSGDPVDPYIHDIHVARDGRIWLGTARGACVVDGETSHCFSADDGLVEGRIQRIVEASDGAIWLSSATHGVSRYDGTSFVRYDVRAGLDSGVVYSLLAEEQGQVLAGTYTGALFRLGVGGVDALALASFPGSAVLSTVRTRDGSLWIGYNGDGLWVNGPGRSGRFTTPGFSPTHVTDIVEDAHGSLWIATIAGLHRLRSAPFVPWGLAEGGADTTFVIEAVPGAADAGVWIGAENAGLFRASAAQGRLAPVALTPALPSQSISALFAESAGRLWVGTVNSGLALVQNGQVVRVVDHRAGLAGDRVFSILGTPAGEIWVGTSGGYSRLDREGNVRQTLTRASGLPDDRVRDARLAPDGALWLATAHGLARLAPDTLQIERWDRTRGLPSDNVSATLIDPDGTVWVATGDRGLARLRDGAVFAFTADQGLPDGPVDGLLDDGLGHLWLTTRGALVRVARDELQALVDGRRERAATRRFDHRQGLRSTSFTRGFQPAAVVDGRGHLWFASSGGAVQVDPARIPPARALAPLIVEEVRIDGVPVAIPGPSQRLAVPAGVQSLEIDYAAPDLLRADAMRFRYRLGSAVADWQMPGERRTAVFTRLPPGQQRFEVQVNDSDRWPPHGVLSRATLALDVAPRWHQTRWFVALAATAGVLSLLAVLQFAGYRQRLQRRHLEGVVAERTQALREALAQVERLSRTDELTGLPNRRVFSERLAMEWEMSRRFATPLSLLVLDVDNFKRFNDAVGHQAGDDCLRALGNLLAAGVSRRTDLVARYGGEEFVILLPGTPGAEALGVAERMLARVNAARLPHPDNVCPWVTVSIGCAEREARDADACALFERADGALYRAKGSGRNRVCAA